MSTRTMTAPPRTAPATRLQEVLLPMDLSDASDAAVAQAARIASRLGDRLTLYHALEFPDHEYGHWAFGHRVAVWDEQERLAREHLADSLEGLDVPHEIVVERVPSALRALLHRLETTPPELTVMSTHPRGAIAHLLAGSVSEQVAERTDGPVLCLRGCADADRLLARSLVLSSDFSEACKPALSLTLRLAQAFGCEVVLVHGAAAPPLVRLPRAGDEPWRPYAQAERWLGSLPGDVTVRVVVDSAPALRAALRLAEDASAGLLVVPRALLKGDRGLASDAGRLVRQARSSVLVV